MVNRQIEDRGVLNAIPVRRIYYVNNDRFYEYEFIINSVLAAIKFPDAVVMFPGNLSENRIYVGSKHRKDCILEVTGSIILVLLPWYRGSENSSLEVIDRIDLSDPDGLTRFGEILGQVLSNRI